MFVLGGVLNKSRMVRERDALQSTKELQSPRKLTFDSSYSCGVKNVFPGVDRELVSLALALWKKNTVGRSDIASEKYLKAQG